MKLEPNRGRRRALLALAAAPIAFHGSRASAQSTWTKPIRLVVPNPAGGGTDVAARIIGQRVSERLGQPVVVDNRPGAGGVVAAEVVTALPLSAAQTKGIASALRTALGKDPEISTRVDPAILGGIKVRVGSRLFDASLKSKLDSLKFALKRA